MRSGVNWYLRGELKVVREVYLLINTFNLNNENINR